MVRNVEDIYLSPRGSPVDVSPRAAGEGASIERNAGAPAYASVGIFFNPLLSRKRLRIPRPLFSRERRPAATPRVGEGADDAC
jgi:hypothetical protein